MTALAADLVINVNRWKCMNFGAVAAGQQFNVVLNKISTGLPFYSKDIANVLYEVRARVYIAIEFTICLSCRHPVRGFCLANMDPGIAEVWACKASFCPTWTARQLDLTSFRQVLMNSPQWTKAPVVMWD